MTRYSDSSNHEYLYSGIFTYASLCDILKKQRLCNSKHLICGGITSSFATASTFGTAILVMNRARLRRKNITLQPLRFSRRLFVENPELYFHKFENLGTLKEVEKYFGKDWKLKGIKYAKSQPFDKHMKYEWESEWFAKKPIIIRGCIIRIDVFQVKSPLPSYPTVEQVRELGKLYNIRVCEIKTPPHSIL